MKPLSVHTYYMNNKKKFFSIFISITLSVILIYTIQMIIYSMMHTGYGTAVEPKTFFSTISPKGEVLNKEIIKEISEVAGVDQIIPCVFDNISIDAGIGSNYGTSVYSLETGRIPEFLTMMGLELIEGELPAYMNQIILHRQIAANKDLTIGDTIGRLVSKKETLPGRYTIVGIIDGPSIVSFAPIEYYIDTYNLPYDYIYGGIILPEENSLDTMNDALDSLYPSNYSIDTLNVQSAWQKEYSNKLSVLVTAINFFIIIIVSSCIGFLCYIYFYQRRSEFGLLWALGFSRQQVINRAFTEVYSICVISYVIGILFAFIVGLLLNILYFIPIGDNLQIIDIKYLLGSACSPIFVTLFSLIPIWRMLKKLDPISIIDGTTM